MNLALSYLTIVEEEIVSLSPVPILTPYLAKERLWDFHLPLKGQNEIFYKFQEYTSSGSIGWLEGRNDRLNGYGGRVEQEVQDDVRTFSILTHSLNAHPFLLPPFADHCY